MYAWLVTKDRYHKNTCYDDSGVIITFQAQWEPGPMWSFKLEIENLQFDLFAYYCETPILMKLENDNLWILRLQIRRDNIRSFQRSEMFVKLEQCHNLIGPQSLHFICDILGATRTFPTSGPNCHFPLTATRLAPRDIAWANQVLLPKARLDGGSGPTYSACGNQSEGKQLYEFMSTSRVANVIDIAQTK